jgi:O-antigen/teichoic acid export membrane protein
VLGGGIVVESVFRWVRPASMAQNKPQLVTFYGIITVVLRIGLVIPLIYYLGAMGAAWAYNAVIVVTVFLIVFYVMPRLGLRGKLSQQQDEESS